MLRRRRILSMCLSPHREEHSVEQNAERYFGFRNSLLHSRQFAWAPFLLGHRHSSEQYDLPLAIAAPHLSHDPVGAALRHFFEQYTFLRPRSGHGLSGRIAPQHLHDRGALAETRASLFLRLLDASRHPLLHHFAGGVAGERTNSLPQPKQAHGVAAHCSLQASVQNRRPTETSAAPQFAHSRRRRRSGLSALRHSPEQYLVGRPRDGDSFGNSLPHHSHFLTSLSQPLVLQHMTAVYHAV
jgi:hypothetical protein